MGTAVPWGRRAARPEDLRLRVLCWNIRGARDGWAPIHAGIRRAGVDIVILEETSGFGLAHDALRQAEAEFAGWSVSRGQDVFIATRLPERPGGLSGGLDATVYPVA